MAVTAEYPRLKNADVCVMSVHWGSFKCYVRLEGVGGYMSKRYEALRGGGGVTSALRNIFFC